MHDVMFDFRYARHVPVRTKIFLEVLRRAPAAQIFSSALQLMTARTLGAHAWAE